jgi:DNA-binding MarR family transcriptional regulator
LSRESRIPLEAAAVEEMRGWQTDQDIFDDLVAIYARLNRTDTRVLDLVDRAGRMTAGEIAASARLSSGAVTALIDRLETQGLVRRVRDATDRRRVLVEVTDKVAELMAPVFGPLAEEGYRNLKEWSDEDLKTVMRFLTLNREALSRHATRVQNLITERERAAKAQPSVTRTSLSTADSAPHSSPVRPRS